MKISNGVKDLPKAYNPREVEDKIYQKWEKSGLFNPDSLEAASDRYWKAEPFSIVMPPPNITAELHVGHSMFLTIQDIMIRRARMAGKKALWLPGTDHAAIATNYVVEREIWQKEKKTRFDLGRAEFLRRVNEFIEKTRGRIQIQIRKMGSSCDWSREKYTLSPDLSLAVRTMFKKMHDAGLIYRGDRLVNWCPRCGTTLADDEVTYRELPGKLYYIRYPFVKGKKSVTVATTRPETMLGDTAVAVKPGDARYKKIVGQKIMLPLVNREIPIIADERVDAEFGTGAVKVTPGHDPNDFEIGRRHKLGVINIFSSQGKIDEREALDHGFEEFANLTPEEARAKIVADLEENKFLEKTEDITHSVGLCYRCGTAVEPMISKQWFVNVNQKSKIKNQNFQKLLKLPEEASLKEMAMAAIKSKAVKIIPQRFEKVYLRWMENLRDWNISRQIWFGHQIPVWYCGGESEHQDITKMGFREDVVKRVTGGMTKTYRLRDHQLEIGSRVAFENSQTGTLFGYATITDVEKTKVGDLELADPAHGEPYPSREKLMADLQKHNPELKVTNDTSVIVYAFAFNPIKGSGESCGEIIVSVTDPEKCPNCGNTSLRQDADTLDTWFSSSLWTFSTLGWPKQTADLKTYHPASIMETGYDILFFWVARMILMTGFALEDIPFQTVYLNGLVRDMKGKKMSKTSGNTINPLEVIEKFGADALRLSLVIGATPGNDIKISEQKIEKFRNFANKLWNIARFTLNQNTKYEITNTRPEPKSLADQWILSELDNLIIQADKYFQTYQYGLAGEALAEFTWNKFADWYIEISKMTLKRHPRGGGDPSPVEAILTYILTTLLKLWHPFIPFVTEHIWTQFSDEFLMIQEYPVPAKGSNSQFSISNFQKLQQLITGLRNLRAEYRLPPGEIFASYLELSKDHEWIREQTPIIEKLARVKINFESMDKAHKMPYFLWDDTKVYLVIPRFDLKKERGLAEKELKGEEARNKKLEAQLNKKDFLKKAPAEVVEQIKSSFKSSKSRFEKLIEKIKSLK